MCVISIGDCRGTRAGSCWDCGDHLPEVTTHGARVLRHYRPSPVVTG